MQFIFLLCRFSSISLVLVNFNIVPVITIRLYIFSFVGGVFRVFGRDSNNCNFDSSVKNTNVPQKKFGLSYSNDRHNRIDIIYCAFTFICQ